MQDEFFDESFLLAKGHGGVSFPMAVCVPVASNVYRIEKDAQDYFHMLLVIIYYRFMFILY